MYHRYFFILLFFYCNIGFADSLGDRVKKCSIIEVKWNKSMDEEAILLKLYMPWKGETFQDFFDKRYKNKPPKIKKEIFDKWAKNNSFFERDTEENFKEDTRKNYNASLNKFLEYVKSQIYFFHLDNPNKKFLGYKFFSFYMGDLCNTSLANKAKKNLIDNILKKYSLLKDIESYQILSKQEKQKLIDSNDKFFLKIADGVFDDIMLLYLSPKI